MAWVLLLLRLKLTSQLLLVMVLNTRSPGKAVLVDPVLLSLLLQGQEALMLTVLVVEELVVERLQAAVVEMERMVTVSVEELVAVELAAIMMLLEMDRMPGQTVKNMAVKALAVKAVVAALVAVAVELALKVDLVELELVLLPEIMVWLEQLMPVLE